MEVLAFFGVVVVAAVIVIPLIQAFKEYRDHDFWDK